MKRYPLVAITTLLAGCAPPELSPRYLYGTWCRDAYRYDDGPSCSTFYKHVDADPFASERDIVDIVMWDEENEPWLEANGPFVVEDDVISTTAIEYFTNGESEPLTYEIIDVQRDGFVRYINESAPEVNYFRQKTREFGDTAFRPFE